jgi:hypothetical protein
MRHLHLALGVALFAPPGLAHSDHPDDAWQPVRLDDHIAHAPRSLPDRVVLTWNGDPATTQAVTWRTDPSVRRASAELVVATDGPRFSEVRSVIAETVRLEADLGEAHYHTVTFTDLVPDTLYAYRVGDGANWSEWFHFRTAKREPAAFTFVYFGDAQNNIKTHWSRVFREAFREAPRAAFTLHAGDLINRANADAEWGEWHGAPAWVNATIPVVATPGNHEYFNLNPGPQRERRWNTREGGSIEVSLTNTPGERGVVWRAQTADGRTATVVLDERGKFQQVDAGFSSLTGWTMADLQEREPDNPPLRDRLADPGVRTLSRHWRPQFAFPSHGPAGLEESAYYLDYQGARIICLNSNERQEEQVSWLREVLATNSQRWTILTFHHPIFSPARNRDNPQLRALWKPVFDEFKVDLVLTGHDHTYARSGDIGAAALARHNTEVGTQNVPEGYQQVYDPAIGTVYVVSVSGPKMYDLTNDRWAVRTAEDTQLYQIITVAGDELRFEARTATNRLYDAFVLRKRPGAANELVELIAPERRRKHE